MTSTARTSKTTSAVARTLTRWMTTARARPLTTIRRVLAVTLLLLALALVACPGIAGGDSNHGAAHPTLVFARDVPLGTTLTAADVRLVELPAQARPRGALTEPDKIAGQRLVGVAREGEPVVDSRLLDRVPTPPGTVTVPVRLGEADIAPLLHPGSRVDVVALDSDPSGDAGKQVLARDVPVLSTLTDDAADGPGTASRDDGPLVLLAAKPDPATRLAAVSLSQPVAVTLR